MRTTHKTKLGLCVLILPHNGIIRLYSFKLGIIDHVDLRALRNQRLAQILCLGSQAVNMIKTDRAVGSGSRAEILQIRTSRIVKLVSDPLIKPVNVGHVLHNLIPIAEPKSCASGFFSVSILTIQVAFLPSSVSKPK